MLCCNRSAQAKSASVCYILLSTKLANAIQAVSYITVKILKFGTPQTIAIIVLKIEKFDVTLH